MNHAISLCAWREFGSRLIPAHFVQNRPLLADVGASGGSLFGQMKPKWTHILWGCGRLANDLGDRLSLQRAEPRKELCAFSRISCG